MSQEEKWNMKRTADELHVAYSVVFESLLICEGMSEDLKQMDRRSAIEFVRGLKNGKVGS